MKKNLTELVMILDRSGSMGGLETDTIGGYNSMLDKQRKAEGDVLVTTILFDDRAETIHDRVPIAEVKPITDKEYYVRGCTALLDAVGNAVEHIRTIHKYAREEDVPEKTIFVITTDGMENASRKYDYATLKKMIEQQKEAAGWEFLFLGANIDAVEVAGRFGIRADRAVRYHSDTAGTALNYEVLADTVCEMRAAPKMSEVGGKWKSRIEEDYEARKGGKGRKR
ncbi:MAG: VWA domain-containing protein [Mogibacterium sp.]|nr:VWA domain-containing protein [Mogibacterium sp.]